MKTAILLHGKPDKEEYYDALTPSPSNNDWFPWLQKQLLLKDIPSQTPEIPNAWKPEYSTWQREFERYDLTEETILVGHSCGAGFLVRWLSEHKDVKAGKVVLVAPSLGLDWEDDSFFKFAIDPDLKSRTNDLIIFGSDNDRLGIKQALQVLQSTVKDIRYKEFSNYGHFCISDTGLKEFPELLAEISN
jgi:predicted alpha/beta hydrolase family esterase